MRKKHKTADKAPDALRILWQEGYFKNWVTQDSIADRLSKRGNNFSVNTLRMALSRAKFLIAQKKAGGTEYIQKVPAISQEVDAIETELFDVALIKKLGPGFKSEIIDLQLNFGRSGNCTAFLLRKLLEKLMYITLAKNGHQPKLEDKNAPGKLVGLEVMINVATQEKLNGIPFLRPQTAQKIQGIKFLGDVSAHNPLTDVDMQTIIPQMPFIITAYKELLR